MAFTASMAFYLIKPALALRLRSELGASAVEVTALTSGFMVSRALAATISGVAGDRYPGAEGAVRRLALFPIAAVGLGYALVEAPGVAVVLSSVHGFLSGMLWLCMQLGVGYTAERGRRNTWLGIYFTAGTFGAAAGYAAYAALPGNRDAILAGSVLYALSGVVALVMLGSSRRRMGKPGGKPARRGGFTGVTFWVLGVAFLTGGVAGLMNEYLYVFLTEVRGLSRGELGYMLAVASLAGAAGGVVAGRLADRRGMPGVARALLVIAGVSLVVLGVMRWWVPVLLGISGVVMATRAVMPLLRNVDIAEGASGTAVGLSNTLSNAGSALFPVIAGWVYEVFPQGGGSGVFAGCGVVMLLLALVSPSKRRT